MKIQNKKTREPMLQRGRDRKRLLDRGRSDSRDLEVQSAGEGGESAAAKRRPDAYQGTARSSSAADSGTAGLTRSDSSKGPPSRKARYAGHVSWDEDEEDENDYDSEASSDMEANVFDVDQEEELSARAATREDAEELARLNEHDRKKRERSATGNVCSNHNNGTILPSAT